jgi:hypothetical protein
MSKVCLASSTVVVMSAPFRNLGKLEPAGARDRRLTIVSIST